MRCGKAQSLCTNQIRRSTSRSLCPSPSSPSSQPSNVQKLAYNIHSLGASLPQLIPSSLPLFILSRLICSLRIANARPIGLDRKRKPLVRGGFLLPTLIICPQPPELGCRENNRFHHVLREERLLRQGGASSARSRPVSFATNIFEGASKSITTAATVPAIRS